MVIERDSGIEIHQVNRAPLIKQDVARLQIQVQDAPLMDVRKPIGEFYRQPEDVLHRQALA